MTTTDPVIATALATIASAISTAILMFAAYHWPAGRNETDDERRHRHARKEEEDE